MSLLAWFLTRAVGILGAITELVTYSLLLVKYKQMPVLMVILNISFKRLQVRYVKNQQL